jgi:hypothetical protein
MNEFFEAEHIVSQQEQQQQESKSKQQVSAISTPLSPSLSSPPPPHSNAQSQSQQQHRIQGFSPLTCLLLTNSPALDFGCSPSLQCKYRKGRCRQPRTIKKNGGLHTFCEYHRVKSCENQRKFDRKRRTKCYTNTMVLRQLDMNQLHDQIPQESIVSRTSTTTTQAGSSHHLLDFPLYLHEPHLYVSKKAFKSNVVIKKEGKTIEQGHFTNLTSSCSTNPTHTTTSINTDNANSSSTLRFEEEKEANMYRFVQQ